MFCCGWYIKLKPRLSCSCSYYDNSHLYQELKQINTTRKQQTLLKTARKLMHIYIYIYINIYFSFGKNIFCIFGLDQTFFDLGRIASLVTSCSQMVTIKVLFFIFQGHWRSLHKCDVTWTSVCGSCVISCWYPFCSWNYRFHNLSPLVHYGTFII